MKLSLSVSVSKSGLFITLALLGDIFCASIQFKLEWSDRQAESQRERERDTCFLLGVGLVYLPLTLIDAGLGLLSVN